MATDLYATLGVKKTATAAEIKAAYRALGYRRVGDYAMLMFGGSEVG